jgi:hypothetical protein
MECTRTTLKRIDFEFQPERGEHTFENLCFAPSGKDENEVEPLTFPHLTSLTLSRLIVSGPSLAKFLSAQPALDNIEFKNIYIGTPDYTWADIAANMPASLREWLVFLSLPSDILWFPAFHASGSTD